MQSASGGLHAIAFDCLMIGDPSAKVAATFAAFDRWRRGELVVEGSSQPVVRRIESPGRPARPVLVAPDLLPQRGLGGADGRAALVHAIAHIEFNAINLAWDAVYRFRDMPAHFYDDWIHVASDEARHFRLLCRCLERYGCTYGNFHAHNGLWEMAVKTDHSCLVRMALVPRVLEARGLDVTPGMIRRLRAAGDGQTADVLQVILDEEVGHVAAGTRWFHWCCERDRLDPTETFHRLIGEYGPGPKPPFNREARLAAGFSECELDRLEGRTAA